MSEIIDFGEAKIRQTWRHEQEAISKCRHLRLTYCTNDQVITCEDCKIQIQPFMAFLTLVNSFKQAWSRLNADKAELKENTSKNIHLIAARKVEKAWRDRSMVPVCPHCSRGIMPEDGFGGSRINRKIEQKRRDAAKPAPVKP